MHKFVQRIKKAIVERQLLQPAQKVIVAVSGGVDSMVLLHVLAELAEPFSWQLTVAHFNHKLRGRSSDADQRLVQQTARQLGLACVCGSADVRRYAKQHRLSIETAARTLRHRFLACVAMKHKARTIALAHHADDQLELFFLRAIRGTGGIGLGGMRWRSPSPVVSQIELIRPLLDQPKAVLLQFATQRKIMFREDATNLATDHFRNRIRNLLLPWLIEYFGTGFVKTIPRLMEIVYAEAEFVSAVAERWLRARQKPAFARLPVAVQRQCLIAQLVGQGIEPGFDLVEKLRLHPQKPVVLQPSLSVTRTQHGKVRLMHAYKPQRKLARFGRNCIELKFSGRAGEVTFDGLKLRWQILQGRGPQKPRAALQQEFFDADKVGSGAVLRHWQPGDRFQPIGMPVAVKLQDQFTNLKVPGPVRRQLVVAQTLTGEIFWVEGLRIGERFKLDNQTRRRLKWSWQRELHGRVAFAGSSC